MHSARVVAAAALCSLAARALSAAAPPPASGRTVYHRACARYSWEQDGGRITARFPLPRLPALDDVSLVVTDKQLGVALNGRPEDKVNFVGVVGALCGPVNTRATAWSLVEGAGLAPAVEVRLVKDGPEGLDDYWPALLVGEVPAPTRRYGGGTLLGTRRAAAWRQRARAFEVEVAVPPDTRSRDVRVELLDGGTAWRLAIADDVRVERRALCGRAVPGELAWVLDDAKDCGRAGLSLFVEIPKRDDADADGAPLWWPGFDEVQGRDVV
jgi:hypothetical protein